MNFEAEIARLKDTLVVTAEIQRRQGEVQRILAEGLVVHDKEMAEIRHTLTEIGDKLAEMGDKLNGLIDVVDGFIRKSPPENGH